MDWYTTKEAALYLGVSAANIKYHVYGSGHLKPLKKGHDLFFTKEMLDEFNAKRVSGEIVVGFKKKGLRNRKE